MKRIPAVAALLFAILFLLPVLAYPQSDKTAETAGMDDGHQLTRARMIEEYVYIVAKDAYIWGWPAVNMYNRRESMRKIPVPVLGSGGITPVAPINHLSMLVDYIKPEERGVVTPNQDVVYGQGFADLSQDAVVFQMPDFKDRYWVFHCMDAYTDVFAAPSSRIRSKSGFYLLVGPEWKGKVPEGIVQVITAPTNLVWYLPRVFMNDTAEDRAAIIPLLNQIAAYPLKEFTGTRKTFNWAKLPVIQKGWRGPGEFPWVADSSFWQDLSAVMAENKPRRGEEALWSRIRWLLKEQNGPAVKRGMDRAVRDGRRIVDAAIMYSNVGTPFGNGWAGALNGGQFGTDYLTRALVAKSYIAVNKTEDAFYLGNDLDADGKRLNGKGNRYMLTFPKGQLPPAGAFWSLTMYNAEHFFYNNQQGRYSLGTKNKNLRFNQDGSLTIYLQNESPGKDKESNWLPAPAAPFSVMIRLYQPAGAVLKKEYVPPAIVRTTE